MSEHADLTVRKLRTRTNIEGSRFLQLYEALTRAESLTDDELTDILRFAVLFSRSDDDIIARLGYRITLQYGEVTRDYEPLRALARARDLTPVVVAAERLNPELREEDSLAAALYAAHSTNFATASADGTLVFRTRGQMALRAFNAREREAVVVAPTSYGKSEMLVDRVASNLVGATCVVVPSRALIAQTRAVLVSDPRVRDSKTRIISHPDAYAGDRRFVAVMTQERLHRLLNEHANLELDQLLLDEAHNLLAGDTRAVDLSQVVLIARARNPELAVVYYTPFLATPENLRHINNRDALTRTKTVNEHVKAERIVHAPLGHQQELYDQFLDRMIPLDDAVPADELEATFALAGHRTLVYVNRPRDAQKLATQLARRNGRVELSVEAVKAVQAIGDLIDPTYSLIEAIRSGVLFHHGQVPDTLRQYIERLFREDRSSSPRILVTTSTLLEGVNTPADRLVMMSPKRGLGYLSRSAFRNLIGRVGRFQEVFAQGRTNLDLLQPRIYLVPSSFAPKNWNVGAYLSRVANLAKDPADAVENPLLDAGPPDGRQEALAYLENVEEGASGLIAPRRALTEVGRLCFKNGVRDFDIFAYEAEIQHRVDRARSATKISEVHDVVATIFTLFLDGVDLTDAGDLERVRESHAARNFYSMFLTWRARNEPFKRMIGRFLAYWSRLDDELVYVGRRWGEEVFGGAVPLFVRMKSKTRAEQINLAVVKIKEEQDFVDFRLIKYVEIMNALGLLESELHSQIKYGTSDPFLICLLKNGFSPDLARLVKESFARHVRVDLNVNGVEVLPGLPDAMEAEGENDILIYEAETLVNSGLAV